MTLFSQADDSYFSDCMELVKKHKLYSLAVELFKSDKEKHKQVLHYYAKYLIFKERHHEAGLSTASLFRKRFRTE